MEKKPAHDSVPDPVFAHRRGSKWSTPSSGSSRSPSDLKGSGSQHWGFITSSPLSTDPSGSRGSSFQKLDTNMQTSPVPDASFRVRCNKCN